MKRLGLKAALTAALLIPSQVQAACWTENQVTAARVRDMETMLMVSSLRCRLQGADFIASYNQFVREARPALTEVNEVLRGHFVNAVGADRALNAYDRYVTGIANRHGAGSSGMSCDDLVNLLNEARGEGNHLARLDRLAIRIGVQPDLQGGRCPWNMASR